MTFKAADEEFAAMAKELYLEHKDDLGLTVDPSRVFFLRSDKKKRAYAYCKLICREYELLTTKKFFIVIVNENYHNLNSEEKKKYVILHELKHLDYNDEKDKYHLLKHSLEDFHELLINPAWNLEMVKDKRVT